MDDGSGLERRGSFSLPVRALDSTDELLNRAKSGANDPAIFQEYPPLFFNGQISSAHWDSYDTQMHPSTLKNYANDANQGRAVLSQHDTSSPNLGYTLGGTYLDGRSSGDGVPKVHASMVVMPFPDVIGTVNRMRAGTLRDLSVGFTGGKWNCSLCGRDMLASTWTQRDACPHLLGVPYPVHDEKGKPTDQQAIARAVIHDAHLSELSVVHDGATPGAMLMKARAMAADGLLTPRERGLVEVRYRQHLPAHAALFPVFALESGAAGGPALPEASPPTPAPTPEPEQPPAQASVLPGPLPTTIPQTPPKKARSTRATTHSGATHAVGDATPTEAQMSDITLSGELFEALRRVVDVPAGADASEVVRLVAKRVNTAQAKSNGDRAEIERLKIEAQRAATLQIELETLRGEMQTQAALAQIGARERERLVTEALKNGVAGFGADKFDPEQKRAALERMDYDELQGLNDIYLGAVKVRLGEGGRLIQDEGPGQNTRNGSGSGSNGHGPMRHIDYLSSRG